MRVVLFIAAIVLPCMCIDETSLRLPDSEQSVDPSQGDMKDQLMNLLGVGDMDVQTLKSNAGRNGGMWVLRSPSWDTGDLILKYRAADAAEPFEEAAQLKLLARMHPGLAQDPDLAFPSMIIVVLGRAGRKQGDFIICRKVHGQMLAGLIAIKYAQGSAGKEELYTIFEKVGQQLRAFHVRYGKQHTDFHGANVLVDTADENRVTFVDLSGIGQDVLDDDLSHFKESLQLLSRFYPPDSFLSDGFEHFHRGYSRSPDTGTARSRAAPEPPRQKRQAPAFQYERGAHPQAGLGGNTRGQKASAQKTYVSRDLHQSYDGSAGLGMTRSIPSLEPPQQQMHAPGIQYEHQFPESWLGGSTPAQLASEQRLYGIGREAPAQKMYATRDSHRDRTSSLGITRGNLVRDSPQHKRFAPIGQETAGQNIYTTQPRKSCSSHSRCRHMSGDCCPLYGDMYMSCCDVGSVPDAKAPSAQRNLASVFAAAPPVAAYEPPSVSLPAWSTPPSYAAPHPGGRVSPPSRSLLESPPSFR